MCWVVVVVVAMSAVDDGGNVSNGGGGGGGGVVVAAAVVASWWRLIIDVRVFFEKSMNKETMGNEGKAARRKKGRSIRSSSRTMFKMITCSQSCGQI